ncbi:hypothetical protein PGB90_009031 [Kerria lacca]
MDKGKQILQRRKVNPKSTPSWADEIDTERDAVDRRKQGASKASHASRNKTTPTLDKPKNTEANDAKPKMQRNDPIWDEAIFVVNVIVKELNQVTEMTPSFA